jgi:hypothetical protein
VGSEDSLLRADLESIYAFTHKGWNPHIVENEVPADLDHVNHSPRFYVVVDGQKGTEDDNTTAAPGSGKHLVISFRSDNSNISIPGLQTCYHR